MGSMKLKKLHDKCMEELEGMYKEGAAIEAAKIPVMKDLSKLVYYLGKICEDCEEEEGYSKNGNSYNSYRGRPRDTMGRYSSGRYPMSYDDGRKNMIHRVGDLMMCTSDERTQNILRNALEQLEMM